MNLKRLSEHTKGYVDNIRGNIVCTEDEASVFDLSVRGKSNQEIASRLCVSVRTVNRIKRKLNCKIEEYEKEMGL